MEELWAMAPSGDGGQGGGGFAMMLPFLLIFAVIYFLMIRPQAKRQKEVQKMPDALKKGDKVITNGGMHGVIVGIKEKEGIVILKVDNEVKIEFQRSAIAKIIEA